MRYQTGSGSASDGSQYRCLEIVRATRWRLRGRLAGPSSATIRGIEFDSVEAFEPAVSRSLAHAILTTVFAASVDGAGSRTGRRIYNGFGTSDSRHLAPYEIAGVAHCYVAGSSRCSSSRVGLRPPNEFAIAHAQCCVGVAVAADNAERGILNCDPLTKQCR